MTFTSEGVPDRQEYPEIGREALPGTSFNLPVDRVGPWAGGSYSSDPTMKQAANKALQRTRTSREIWEHHLPRTQGVAMHGKDSEAQSNPAACRLCAGSGMLSDGGPCPLCQQRSPEHCCEPSESAQIAKTSPCLGKIPRAEEERERQLWIEATREDTPAAYHRYLRESSLRLFAHEAESFAVSPTTSAPKERRVESRMPRNRDQPTAMGSLLFGTVRVAEATLIYMLAFGIARYLNTPIPPIGSTVYVLFVVLWPVVLRPILGPGLTTMPIVGDILDLLDLVARSGLQRQGQQQRSSQISGVGESLSSSRNTRQGVSRHTDPAGGPGAPGKPPAYGRVSCASCRQDFYGEVREDGSCPLCGGVIEPQG